MKVLERSGAKAGDYKAAYMGLISPGNKPGLRDTKGGKRLMFKLKSDKEEIAASVTWNPKDERGTSTLGALGVPADSLFKVAKLKGEETAILWFDKKAREAAEYGVTVNAYVREDGGFASGIRPIDGEFEVKFLRIRTRKDADYEKGVIGTPYWQYKPSVHKSNGKKSWDTEPMNMFWVSFVVISGARRGAIVDKMYHYSIVKDEDDEWVLDGQSTRGAEFKKLLSLHGIEGKKLRPDKNFKDPSNGLPELEPLMIKNTTPMKLSVKDGWAGELKPAKGDGSIDADALDVGSDGGSELMLRLTAMIEKRVRRDHDKSAWLSNGHISETGLIWVRSHLGVTLRKMEIDPHLTGLEDGDIESLIAVIKRKYPLSVA